MFYSLEFADTKITGVYPQLELKPDVYMKNNNPDFKKLNSSKLVIDDLNLNDFVISDKANSTDILSCQLPDSSIGLFINKNAYDVFKTYVNKHISIIELLINEEKYFFMNIVDCVDSIDFLNSNFSDILNPACGKFKVKSYTEYLEHNRSRKIFLEPDSLKIEDNLEIMRLPFDTSIIVSERVKNEIEKSKITGLEINSYDTIILI